MARFLAPVDGQRHLDDDRVPLGVRAEPRCYVSEQPHFGVATAPFGLLDVLQGLLEQPTSIALAAGSPGSEICGNRRDAKRALRALQNVVYRADDLAAPGPVWRPTLPSDFMASMDGRASLPALASSVNLCRVGLIGMWAWVEWIAYGGIDASLRDMPSLSRLLQSASGGGFFSRRPALRMVFASSEPFGPSRLLL